MSWIEQFLVEYPELAVFLAISIGYLIGDVKFRGFRLGPVTGSLFAGILIGVRRCSNLGNGEVVFVPPVLSGIGYSVGPQFLQSRNKTG
jgi:putative transport protein